MKKKLFREVMNFDKAEMLQSHMSNVGIQIGRPATTNEARKTLLESYGWFGATVTNNYYHDINNASEVIPKPEDYVLVPFRLISATIVGAYTWKAADFSQVDLQGSMKLLQNKPVYKNHEMEVDNWVGHVQALKFTSPFTNSTGEQVPAGIDGILALDTKVDPKTARGAVSGAIYSNSVTVEFDWEQSHTFENDYDFLDKLGTIGKDGKMVRRIVKNIYNYHETSLVFLGADPYAKKIDEAGNLIAIDTTSVANYSKATDKEKEELKKGMIHTGGIDKSVISYMRENFAKEQPEKETTKNEKEMNKKFIAALAKVLGITEESKIALITEENFESYMAKLTLAEPEKLTELAALTAKSGVLDNVLAIPVVSLEADKPAEKIALTGEGDKVALPTNFATEYQFIRVADLTSLQTSLTTANTDKANLQKEAEIGQKYVKMQREEAKRLYSLAVDGKPNAAVVSLFDKAEPAELEGLLAQYTQTVTSKFTATCTDCKSTNVTFQSALATEEPTTEKETDAVANTTEVKTFEDIYAEKSRGNFHIRSN